MGWLLFFFVLSGMIVFGLMVVYSEGTGDLDRWVNKRRRS